MSARYLKKCVGKRKHETKKEAEDQRKYMVTIGLWTLTTSRAYGCNQCGSYHAGRINGAGQRRKG